MGWSPLSLLYGNIPTPGFCQRCSGKLKLVYNNKKIGHLQQKSRWTKSSKSTQAAVCSLYGLHFNMTAVCLMSPLKVIPFNYIAHPFCPSFFAWLARARSELDGFPMEAELFREINGRFLPNELSDPTFLFHLFKKIRLYMIYIQIWRIFHYSILKFPVDSLLQSDFRRFTATVQTLDLPIISK